MAIIKESKYKGIDIPNAVFTVEYVTVSSQLDFFVSMRASTETEILSGEYLGCPYDPASGTPMEQAYAYLSTLERYM